MFTEALPNIVIGQSTIRALEIPASKFDFQLLSGQSEGDTFNAGRYQEQIDTLFKIHPDRPEFDRHQLLDVLLVFQYFHDDPQPEYKMRFKIALDSLSPDEKINIIKHIFLELEERYLRVPSGEPRMDAYKKLGFLCADVDTFDVTELVGLDGRKAYTRVLPRDRIKTPEVFEFFTAASDHDDLVDEYIEQGKEDQIPIPVKALSELADLVYNILQLERLDSVNTSNYRDHLNRIVGQTGLTLNQMLLITLIKYNFRYGFGKSRKDIHLEEKAIEALFLPRAFLSPAYIGVKGADIKNMKKSAKAVAIAYKHFLDRRAELKRIYEFEKNLEVSQPSAVVDETLG